MAQIESISAQTSRFLSQLSRLTTIESILVAIESILEPHTTQFLDRQFWKKTACHNCEFDYWPSAVNMPPTKVFPQCKAAVSVRWSVNAVIMSFDPNQKQSVSCERKLWNQLGKLKISCTRPVRASEIREQTLHTSVGRNKTECAWQAWESYQAVIDSNQHTSTITCTAALRVWHLHFTLDYF